MLLHVPLAIGVFQVAARVSAFVGRRALAAAFRPGAGQRWLLPARRPGRSPARPLDPAWVRS